MENGGESPCTEIYKCKNEDFDEFGICQSSCEDGWVDEYCLSKGSRGVVTITEIMDH